MEPPSSDDAATGSEREPVRLETLLSESAWVRSLAESLVRDPAAADDIVQETWLAALEHPPRAGRPLRPWLRRVVGNFARMRGRSERARLARERTASRREGAFGAEELYERVETQRMLAKHVLEIEEPFRSTLVLRYYEGLSSAEIARRSGAPEATVRWRHMRGLELLRERLDRGHGGERRKWLTLVLPLAGGGARSGAGAGSLAWLAGLLALLGVLAALAVERWSRPATRGEAVATAPQAPEQRISAESTSQRDEVAAPRAPDAVPESRSGSSVVARIVGPAGAPVAGAALSVSLGSERLSARAAEDGSVRLDLPALASEVLAEVSAEAPAHLRRIERAVLGRGDVHLGDLALAPSGAVEGEVVDAAGAPLAGALARAEVIGSRWSAFAVPPLEEARHLGSMLPEGTPEARTDARGRYRIEGLPESYVRLWISGEGRETVWSDAVAVLAGSNSRAPPVTLREPEPAHAIEGVVLGPDGSPVAGAGVEAGRVSIRPSFFRGSSNVIRGRADSRGRFRLQVDPASNYDVAAADPVGAFRPIVVSPVAPGERALELRLAAWRPLEVVLRDSQGLSVSGAEIAFLDKTDEELLQSETDSWRNGACRAPFVSFLVEATHPLLGRARAGPFEPASSPPVVEIAFPPSPRIRGTVRRDGSPVAGAFVELAASAKPPQRSERAAGGEPFTILAAPEGSLTCATGPDGRFELAVAPGTSWRIRAGADAHASRLSEPISAESIGEVEIVLLAPGTLEGRLVPADGSPAAGRIVGVSRGDGFVAARRVGPDGSYRFESLPPGEWQVRPVAEEALGWEHLRPARSPAGAPLPGWDAVVASGEVARFDLLVAPSASVSIEGRLTFDGESVGSWMVELTARGRPPVRAAVDPRGRFAAELDKLGEGSLRAFSVQRSGPAYELAERISIAARRFEYARDWKTAALELRGGRPGSELDVRWTDGAATLLVTHVFDGAGTARIERVPAGRLAIAGPSVEDFELELAPGESRVVALEQ